MRRFCILGFSILVLLPSLDAANRNDSAHILKLVRPKDQLSPLIDTPNFMSISDHIYIGKGSLKFDRIKDGDIIFIETSQYTTFMRHDFPKIKSKVILFYTILYKTRDGKMLGYDYSTDWYKKMLDDDRVIAWYGRNIYHDHPKAHIVPLGLGCGQMMLKQVLRDFLSQLNPSLYFREKKTKCLVNFRITGKRRRYLKKALPKMQHASLFTFKNELPFNTYIKCLKNSEFILSPRGACPDCYRTWEALYAGVIPIVEKTGIEKVYQDLPVLIIDNFENLTEKFLDAAKKEMSQKTYKLEKLTSAYWLNLILDHQKAVRESFCK